MLILVNLHVNQSIKPYLIFFPFKKKKKNHLLVHDFFGKNSFYDENFFPFFFFFLYIYIVRGRNPRSKDSSYENIPRRQLGLIVHQIRPNLDG